MRVGLELRLSDVVPQHGLPALIRTLAIHGSEALRRVSIDFELNVVVRDRAPLPQARLERRMAHLGIRVKALHEEEYCLIPMGGVLPRVPQRVLGIGGTAGMVHPSTGGFLQQTTYHVLHSTPAAHRLRLASYCPPLHCLAWRGL